MHRNYFQLGSHEMATLVNDSDRNIVRSVFQVQFNDNACLRCCVRSEHFWLQRFSTRGVRSVFYDRIDYPRTCTWGTSATYVCQTSEQSKVFHGLELTDRFSYGPLLLQPRATMQRRHFAQHHRQVARSRRDKEPRVLPIRTSDTAV